MMPVPPPLRLEFGTAVRATPRKVTAVMLASAVDASSTATPTTSTRSAPPPTVCDHDNEVRPVDVVAARLAASKPMAACADGDAANIAPTTHTQEEATLAWERGSMECLLLHLRRGWLHLLVSRLEYP
jgi:hypothetical protein